MRLGSILAKVGMLLFYLGKMTLENKKLLCYYLSAGNNKDCLAKGGLAMQKNRNNQNRIEKLTVKGTEVLSYYR